MISVNGVLGVKIEMTSVVTIQRLKMYVSMSRRSHGGQDSIIANGKTPFTSHCIYT
jgi:hypothetical protein